MSFTTSVSGNPIIVDHSMRANLPHFPHPVAGYVLIRDIDLHMERMPVDRAWVKKTGYKALSAVKKLEGALFGKRSAPDGMRVLSAERFPGEVDALWDEASKSYDYVGVRDSSYLNWRYCDSRSGPFTTLLAYDGDMLVGYLVYAVNSFLEGYPVGYIVDLLTLPDKPEAADLLMGEALEALWAWDVNIVNGLAVKGSQQEEAYKASGFLDSLVRLHVFMRPVASQAEIQRLSSLAPDRIYFTWGDHDTLPLTTGTDSL
ncbi:MAG TPA: hypothetical protein VMW22_03780 [Candidatus Desulfaltia sp.]|nr:hypothetical protein [Candidatus Desulfaltia sp.]